MVHVVDIVGGVTGELVATLRVPHSASVRDVKVILQEAYGINVFCQRLAIRPTDAIVEDRVVLDN